VSEPVSSSPLLVMRPPEPLTPRFHRTAGVQLASKGPPPSPFPRRSVSILTPPTDSTTSSTGAGAYARRQSMETDSDRSLNGAGVAAPLARASYDSSVHTPRRRSTPHQTRHALVNPYSPATEPQRPRADADAGHRRDSDAPSTTTPVRISRSLSEAADSSGLYPSPVSTDSLHTSGSLSLASSSSSAAGSIGSTVSASQEAEAQAQEMLRSSVPAADLAYMGEVYRDNFEHVARIGGAASQHGVVFRARSRIDGVDYAIKVKPWPGGRITEDSPSAKEMLALAALPQHPNIVRYHTAWVDTGNIYVQLELCWGGSLSTQLDVAKVSFTERQVRECGRQIASGLAHLHALNLAHLDVKPDNIFVAFSQVAAADPIRAAGIVQDSSTSSETVFRRLSPRLHALPSALGSATVERTVAVDEHCSYRIGDFGLVTALDDPARAEDGDARYLPREMLERDVSEPDVDLTKVDVFSLGATLLQLSLGTDLPGSGPVWDNIRTGELPSLPPTFSTAFTSLLRSMLSKHPEERPSAGDLLNHPLLLPWPLDALQSTVRGQYSLDPAVGRLDEAFSTLSPR